ncbi:DUF885 domain-containing protein [Xanthomonas citri pv. fuscans CFBP 6996]|uniref:DUF885 domain-containing protein n=1 Tax=Xanthomonas citri TaxID=346 RepID=UPI000C178C12|nr:DUF885 family protein [Xanthomonas citri]ATS49652.1 DUF885 family protein [Xanthomonas citri pv. phaseoli var. fuscans]ATS55388.1 DUF885 family protein [Xanthomonas citri pv. phaseoli var. fuscans]ATS60600.1 DUF885 family protein [Xanthomonas citri pv. phaseoli var. fuscans]PTY28785.1 DUF885 domain-containing protein [Xanthomonas citri pv. fuscans CFBP 6996]QWN18131.1 DUF885 domain-containing protein [Xanthomonas citri]
MTSPLAAALSLALLGAGFAATSAQAATPPAPATLTAEAPADARFRAIYEKEWAWRQAETGQADEDSDTTGDNTHLPDVSATAQQARLAVWDGVLKQLEGIDPKQLSPANQINFAIYRPQVENLAAEVRLRAYEMPFNSDSSFWSNLGFMAQRPMKTAAEYRAYIARLNDVPRYFEQQTVNMRAGLARGFSVPRAVLDGRDVSIATVADVKDPTESTFYAPFKQLPAQIPAAEQAQLREQAEAALRTAVLPAYSKLLTFFRNDYMPKARTTLAAEALPDGKAFYRQQIREYTTLELTPEQIHRIGLDEVARIQTQMNAIIKQVGFKGSFAQFLTFLRTDPQFYAKTPQELLDRAAWISKRVDGQVGKFIGTLPRGRFTIKPVPDDIAPFWTAGRGGATTYWVNTYNLPSRPLYNLPALTLHESSPGHSLQGSLALEQGEQPAFRRENYISAYGEGWALYTEKLGQEMGIYETPYEEFGRLTYEMWRACRLVIDTGVHHDGWSREQALAYLRDRTALSEHEVTTEVDRYISWPGQALSYKLGEITIVKLRAEAEKELGDRFDIKAFHDVVLRQGSVTLPVLEQQVRAFIAEGKARPATSNKPRAAAP